MLSTGLNQLAERIYQNKCSAPVIFLLESSKPIAGLGREATAAILPLLSMFSSTTTFKSDLSALFSEGGFEELIVKLESLQRGEDRC